MNVEDPISWQTAVEDSVPKIVVVGVGGAGGNAVNNMIANELTGTSNAPFVLSNSKDIFLFIGVDFVVCNTDAQHLKMSLTPNQIQMGSALTGGLGCGANPELGKLAADDALEEILQKIGHANMVFIAAGMGGGTGTGAAPVIAKAAMDAGILTVGVVTKVNDIYVFELKENKRIHNMI